MFLLQGRGAIRTQPGRINGWEWAEPYLSIFKVGKADLYINHFAAIVETCRQGRLSFWSQRLPVWIYCRKSDCASDNLAEMVAKAVSDVLTIGDPIVGIVGLTACVETSNPDSNRSGLREAWEGARAKGALIVAPDRTRILRHPLYNGSADSDVPRIGDYRMIRSRTAGVGVATILPPGSAPGEIRSAQTKRGKAAKGNPGGRPIKGRDLFREKRLPKARELHEAGFKLRHIAAEIHRLGGRRLSHEGVRKWLSRPI